MDKENYIRDDIKEEDQKAALDYVYFNLMRVLPYTNYFSQEYIDYKMHLMQLWHIAIIILGIAAFCTISQQMRQAAAVVFSLGCTYGIQYITIGFFNIVFKYVYANKCRHLIDKDPRYDLTFYNLYLDGLFLI